MKKCEHKNVVYHGEQETLDPEKPLHLYNCLNCKSTITLKHNPQPKVIINKNKIKNTVDITDITKELITDVTNILRNYIEIKKTFK